MNLHVTNDSYGLYPVEIAKRIKSSVFRENNLMVNLYPTSFYTDDIITNLIVNDSVFKNYISNLVKLDKIIFHPYNFTAYRFLKMVLKKFPNVKVYWMCWSYELYNLPHLIDNLYDPFSANYLKKKKTILTHTKEFIKNSLAFLGLKKSYWNVLKHSYSLVHFFCSPFYSDFLFLQTVTPNTIQYLPVAYLSLNKIMPDLNKFRSTGNKIMIGHSSLPEGNHYEIIQKISKVNNSFPFFLPLAYGDKEYGDLIKEEARKKFTDLEILKERLDKDEYYQKLTEVGWAIFNVKVQQGVGNLLALIWMGAKIFLDKNSAIYKDLTKNGVVLFSVQDDLTKEALSNKLSFEQAENNRQKILEKFNENAVSQQWQEFLR